MSNTAKFWVIASTLVTGAIATILVWAFYVSPFLFPGGFSNPLYFLRLVLAFGLGYFGSQYATRLGKAWYAKWTREENRDAKPARTDSIWNKRWR